jgi:hypothetical protein
VNVSSLITGKSRQLDGRAAPEEIVTESDVSDASKLAKLLTRIVRDLAALRARFYPRRTDFEDVAVGAGTTHRLPHNLGGRVRWWVVDQSGAAAITKNASTDANVLVLDSAVACRVTIRVEEAG